MTTTRKSLTTRDRNERLWLNDGDNAVFAHPKRGDLLVRINGVSEVHGGLMYYVEEVATALRYPVMATLLRRIVDVAERERLLRASQERGERRDGRQAGLLH